MPEKIGDGAMQPFALTVDKFLAHAAKWHPKAEVVTVRDGEAVRFGYADLMDRSQRVSAVLQDFGVRPGERVATLGWNTHAHIEALYGITGMGAVCHTLNPRLTAAQLAEMVDLSQARVIMVSADLVPLARQVVAGLAHVSTLLVMDGAPETAALVAGAEVRALEPLIAAMPHRPAWGEFDERSPSGLCFTSGTTGAPKGVTYTHRSSFLHTLRVLQADVMAITGADSVLAMVQLFHANAWGLPFAAPAVGAKLVLPGRQADGASLAQLIRSENVTIAVGVPTVWLGLVEHLEATGETLPSLKRIVMGGAPLAPALMERIERHMGVVVQTSWGMTELSPSGVVAPPWLPVRQAALSGRPAIGVDLRLTDAEGQILADQRDVEGHLWVKGAAVVERYFGQAEAVTDADGWFATGDLARIDADGNLMITGRAKDLIKSGGEWINPAEIEAVVGALAEVALVAVIGRSDVKWGERPLLLVQLREGASVSDEALLGALKGRVASWWIPDEVVRVRNMPLASTGKIDKMTLRKNYGSDSKAIPWTG